MTWYAVRDDFDREADPTRQIWTVGKNPKRVAWDTDSGCDGYGLTKAEAEFLAQAANEKEARDGVEGPWKPKRDRFYDDDYDPEAERAEVAAIVAASRGETP